METVKYLDSYEICKYGFFQCLGMQVTMALKHD